MIRSVHLGEDGEGKGEVVGRDSDGGMEDAAGNEGVAEEAGDNGVGENGVEAMTGVAALEREKPRVSLEYMVGGGPLRVLPVVIVAAAD